MQDVCLNTANLEVMETIVEKVIIENQKVKGVQLQGGKIIEAKAVIITSGTFMSSLVMVGHSAIPSELDDEPTTELLSQSLERCRSKNLPFENRYASSCLYG